MATVNISAYFDGPPTGETCVKVRNVFEGAGGVLLSGFSDGSATDVIYEIDADKLAYIEEALAFIDGKEVEVSEVLREPFGDALRRKIEASTVPSDKRVAVVTYPELFK